MRYYPLNVVENSSNGIVGFNLLGDTKKFLTHFRELTSCISKMKRCRKSNLIIIKTIINCNMQLLCPSFRFMHLIQILELSKRKKTNNLQSLYLREEDISAKKLQSRVINMGNNFFGVTMIS